MEPWQLDPLGTAQRGENPTVIARMKMGWAVIGDTQHLPGYCLLLYQGQANHLTDLPRLERANFLYDLALLGESVATVCARRDPKFSRINYEVLGNSWPHLHGHVHARYEWEPKKLRRGPVWRYQDRKDLKFALGSQHAELKNDIGRELKRVLEEEHG
jgi:diadenosine tetraphosphate (Ap4A) HIT family hydrolase